MPRVRYRIMSVFALLATLLGLLWPGEHLLLLASGWPWHGSVGPAGFSQLDKLIHFSLFAICGYLTVLGWVSRTVQALPLYLGLLALGGGTEWLQASIPERGADIRDMLADALGAAAGVALGLYLLRRKPPGRGLNGALC